MDKLLSDTFVDSEKARLKLLAVNSLRARQKKNQSKQPSGDASIPEKESNKSTTKSRESK